MLVYVRNDTTKEIRADIENGKVLGALEKVGKNVHETSRGGCAGGTVWDVTLGDAKENPAKSFEHTLRDEKYAAYAEICFMFVLPCVIVAASIMMKRYWRKSKLYGRVPDSAASSASQLAGGEYDLD